MRKEKRKDERISHLFEMCKAGVIVYHAIAANLIHKVRLARISNPAITSFPVAKAYSNHLTHTDETHPNILHLLDVSCVVWGDKSNL